MKFDERCVIIRSILFLFCHRISLFDLAPNSNSISYALSQLLVAQNRQLTLVSLTNVTNLHVFYTHYQPVSEKLS